MGIHSFRKYGSDSEPVFIIGDVELDIEYNVAYPVTISDVG